MDSWAFQIFPVWELVSVVEEATIGSTHLTMFKSAALLEVGEISNNGGISETEQVKVAVA